MRWRRTGISSLNPFDQGRRGRSWLPRRAFRARGAVFSGGQRSAVDHEAVPDIAPLHAVIGFIDLLDWDHLDVRHDPLLGTEIEHLLRLGDAPDQGTRDGSP